MKVSGENCKPMRLQELPPCNVQPASEVARRHKRTEPQAYARVGTHCEHYGDTLVRRTVISGRYAWPSAEARSETADLQSGEPYSSNLRILSRFCSIEFLHTHSGAAEK